MKILGSINVTDNEPEQHGTIIAIDNNRKKLQQQQVQQKLQYPQQSDRPLELIIQLKKHIPKYKIKPATNEKL